MVSVLLDLEAILDARADGAALEPNQRVCAADPTVQAVVAKLNTAMTTSMGILACMTTAWWGSVSRSALLPIMRQLRTDLCPHSCRTAMAVRESWAAPWLAS